MSKRAWKQDGSLLVRMFGDGVEDLRMELSDLWKDWEELEEVQRCVVSNGVKQKLADLLAVGKGEELTEAEKRQKIENKWIDISQNRQWNSTARVGTQSAPLSKTVPALKEAGFSIEKIATLLGRPEHLVKAYYNNN